MTVRVLQGDCRTVLTTLPDQSVNCIVTSPPYYGLRDYGVAGQIGLEQTPEEYVAQLVSVFREARRVLRDDGTFWLNIGDSYANLNRAPGSKPLGRVFNDPDAWGSIKPNSAKIPDGLKPKDLIGMPWMVAFALRADGWYLRDAIIWHKVNPMPESVSDRCTKSYENVFMFSKRARYFFDAAAIVEPSGANRRNVWTIATEPSGIAHYAIMPTALAELCIKAGCPAGGTVMDPFGGAGTTGLVADRLGRNAILIELNPANTEMTRRRIEGDAGMFANVMEAAE